jgi:nitrogen regulatory protein PII
MKAVLIVYNQAFSDRVEFVLDQLEIRGFTRWENVQGRGTEKGEPRMGTHTWPEMNSSVLTIVEENKVNQLLEKVKSLDEINEEVGIRAFVWEILNEV